jgi:hypothetical protein
VSQSDGREAFPGAADLPPVSESAIRAFSEALPKLLSLVNDKFAVDERVLKKQQPEDLKFIYDAHHHFGDMLRAIFEFDLYDHMLGEFAWYVSALSSRGFKESYFRRMVEAWMIAIHSSIKPPESGELTASLEYLCRHSRWALRHSISLVCCLIINEQMPPSTSWADWRAVTE